MILNLQDIDAYIQGKESVDYEDYLSISEYGKLIEWGFKLCVYENMWPIFIVYEYEDDSFLLAYKSSSKMVMLLYFDKLKLDTNSKTWKGLLLNISKPTCKKSFDTYDELLDYLEIER